LTLESDEAKKSSEKVALDKLLGAFLDYQSSERRAISASIPGAVIENVIDITHPMSLVWGLFIIV
jgi:hypothetical protein